MNFVEQKYLNKNETESKMENPLTKLSRDEPSASAHIGITT